MFSRYFYKFVVNHNINEINRMKIILIYKEHPDFDYSGKYIFRNSRRININIKVFILDNFNELPKMIEAFILDNEKNLYHYDVNSLYPTSMLKFDMPIGNIKYFIGNILNIIKNPLGFFKVKITTPKYLVNPILQIRYNNRTVSPLGSFTAWFFSEELFNVKNMVIIMKY